MRWGFAALAAGAVLTWTDATRPASFLRAGGPAELGSPGGNPAGPVRSGMAAVSLFEDFPFSLSDDSGMAGFDPPGGEVVALDPDPDRFGPGRSRVPEDVDPPTALVPVDDDRRTLAGAGGALWEKVLSDPLLRDLFGPGPLARFLDELLRGARGEGSPTVIASIPPVWEPARPSLNRRSGRPGLDPNGLPWPGVAAGVPGGGPRPDPSGPAAVGPDGGPHGEGRGGGFDGGGVPLVGVPEPASVAAFLFGLVGLLAAARRAPG